MIILKIRVILVSSFLLSMSPSYAGSIDRHALVTRHNIIIEKPDEQCALQVGNGEFAFNVDVTGLQTFYGNTLSQWGWHSSPLSAEEKIEDYRWPEWDHAGRKVPYMTGNGVQDNLRHWLYTNPHRLPLGRKKIGCYQ